MRKFPLPVEVVPIEQSYVVRELIKLSGHPKLRACFIIDNGNIILDVPSLKIYNPTKLGAKIDNIAGVVTNRLFAMRPTDILLLGSSAGLKLLLYNDRYNYLRCGCDCY